MKPIRVRGLVAILALSVALGACGPREPERIESTAPPEAEKTELEHFWELYRDATEARTEGRSDEAIALYREVLEIRPEHGDSLHFLAQLLYARADVVGARELLETLIRSEDHSLRGYQQLSVVEGMPIAGRVAAPARALAIVGQAVEWNPGNSGAQGLRARWAAYAGLEREARKALAAALGHNPGEFQAALVADWLMRREDPEAPADVLVRLCEAADCAGRPESAAALAAAAAGERLPDDGAAVARAPTALPREPGSTGKKAARLRPSDSIGRRSTVLEAALDLDADGEPDLSVIADSVGEPARLLTTVAGPVVELPADRPIPGWVGAGEEDVNVAAPWRGAFLDGPDGLRVVIVGGGSDPVRLFGAAGSGRWRTERVTGLPSRVFGSVLATADFDQDGLTDLVVGNVDDAGGFGARLLYARSDGGFEEASDSLPPLSAALAADLDGDGASDLLLALAPEAVATEETQGAHTIRALLDIAGRRLQAPADMLPSIRAPVTDLALTTAGQTREIYVAMGELAPEIPHSDRLWRRENGRYVDVTSELGRLAFGDTVRVLTVGDGGLRVLRGGLVPGDRRRVLRLEPAGR